MKHKLPEELQYLANWYDEDYCLDKVEVDGWALQCVKVQTPEICLKAIKQSAKNIKFIKKQSYDIIVVALERNYHEALQFIDWEILTEEEFEYIKLRYLM